jgi:FKBP-type peptidyl-prolyl cis-trans isomerase 2
MIEEGSRVAIEYTLSLDDGTEVDGNVGDDPLVYQHGEGQILPALESALEGMGIDDVKKVTLAPEQGYGEWTPEATQEVSLQVIPENLREVGKLLAIQDGQGNRLPAKVHELSDETALLDLNHPLAGQKLHFEVRVVQID